MYHFVPGISSGIQGAFPYIQEISPGFQAGNFLEGMQTFPRVDIAETPAEIVYILDVPGVDPNAVNVQIGENTLHIEGRIDIGPGIGELNYLYRERPIYNKYTRLLSIPLEVDSDRAEANVKNGILMVRFPKKNTGRRLPVNQQQQQQAQPTGQTNFNPPVNFSPPGPQ